MAKTNVEVGQMFGYLKVLSEIEPIRVGGRSIRMLKLECICGNIVDKQLKVLKMTTRCCGCTHLKPGYRPSIKVGDKFKTKQGFDVIVTEYLDGCNIKAKFEEPRQYEFKTYLGSLKTGSIKNKYHPSIYGVGYMGVGPYDFKENNQAHSHFTSMFERCYDEVAMEKRKTYTECEVRADWHDFQSFAQWCDGQVGFKQNRWQLDKDILVKGNKTYAPEFCCFVPSSINALFTKRQACRGNCPIGVYEYSAGIFRAVCSNEFMGEKRFSGKLRSSVEEAFQDYKQYKEKVIKQRVDFYKDSLDPKVYEALCNYQVEITD